MLVYLPVLLPLLGGLYLLLRGEWPAKIPSDAVYAFVAPRKSKGTRAGWCLLFSAAIIAWSTYRTTPVGWSPLVDPGHFRVQMPETRNEEREVADVGFGSMTHYTWRASTNRGAQYMLRYVDLPAGVPASIGPALASMERKFRADNFTIARSGTTTWQGGYPAALVESTVQIDRVRSLMVLVGRRIYVLQERGPAKDMDDTFLGTFRPTG